MNHRSNKKEILNGLNSSNIILKIKCHTNKLLIDITTLNGPFYCAFGNEVTSGFKFDLLLNNILRYKICKSMQFCTVSDASF